eukprot:4192930-Amphidinium_carterae.1
MRCSSEIEYVDSSVKSLRCGWLGRDRLTLRVAAPESLRKGNRKIDLQCIFLFGTSGSVLRPKLFCGSFWRLESDAIKFEHVFTASTSRHVVEDIRREDDEPDIQGVTCPMDYRLQD